jgi:hypothetical protein
MLTFSWGFCEAVVDRYIGWQTRVAGACVRSRLKTRTDNLHHRAILAKTLRLNFFSRETKFDFACLINWQHAYTSVSAETAPRGSRTLLPFSWRPSDPPALDPAAFG